MSYDVLFSISHLFINFSYVFYNILQIVRYCRNNTDDRASIANSSS